MGVKLISNEYGKTGIRLVHVSRDGDRHELRDLAVDVALSGDFAAAHVDGDNANVLPTDTQKNTVYAFAGEHGIDQIETFALLLARHFVESQPPVARATVSVQEYSWARVGPHSFRDHGETRSATVAHTADRTKLTSGTAGFALLNTTGSEFAGFASDRYTTLPQAKDRILATGVSARWTHTGLDVDWAESYAATTQHLIEAFAETYSHSLQHTLYAMAGRVLEHRPEVASIRLTLPNRHHVLVDLEPFGLTNENEVYAVPDRPYGLIEAAVAREGAAGEWWD